MNISKGTSWAKVLIEKCELKLKTLIFAQNITILKYLEIEPFATFKQPFATCGEWRMGWTTLLYTMVPLSLPRTLPVLYVLALYLDQAVEKQPFKNIMVKNRPSIS